MVTHAARLAIESLYDCTADVYEYRPQKGSGSSITTYCETLVYTAIPCRLSFGSTSSTDNSGEAAKIQQTVKLFIAPEINILAGSKIVVTGREQSTAYCCSGKPARYDTHQEITLDLFERWA
ncbi:hypothetical protein C12CBH8_12740 [Solibaculum mannosilyticum]|uniref:Uncharacterized protein n=1 Tax=Solibaculum mannosilyticum TaxID=2780922 RepID=A0A7I8D3Q1_9FIRM|nr:hypothetical protein C12CBH8_12740 [Solibaculum mannosilyticum]